MKIVIQCASTKNTSAAQTGLRSTNGNLVKFVSRPEVAPFHHDYVYAKPDDLADRVQTWRARILEYNRSSENPLGLMPAYKLYRHRAYVNLVNAFGIEKVFILSAGWGLISADFLTPDYDITFSTAKNVAPHARRVKSDHYADFCMLPDDNEDVIFLGGKDYQSLFIKLTRCLKAQKLIMINSNQQPRAPSGFSFKRFDTAQKTNWHYSCAQALIERSRLIAS